MFAKLLIWALLNYVCVSDKYINRCTKNIHLYKAMKCIPKYSGANRNCPLQYDCSFVMNTPPCMCHFQGKYYKKGQQIPFGQTSTSCLAGCLCVEMEIINTKRQIMDFTCAQIDCPVHLPSYKRNIKLLTQNSECYEYFKKPLDVCAEKYQCPPFKGLHKCKFEGTLHIEGERFHPRNRPCTWCVCQKSTKKVVCGDFTCGNEIGNSMEIRNYYAPYYLPQIECCPYSWLTPQPIGNRTILKTPKRKGPKCRFGKILVSLGKTFEITENNRRFKCTCEIPPFLTCLMILNKTVTN